MTMNTETGKGRKKTRALFIAVAGVGAIFGLWAMTAFVSLLAQVDWNFTEVIRQYLNGKVSPFQSQFCECSLVHDNSRIFRNRVSEYTDQFFFIILH